MAEPSEEHFKEVSKVLCSKMKDIEYRDANFLKINNLQDSDIDFFILRDSVKIGIQHKRLEEIEQWIKTSVQTSRIMASIEEAGNRMNLKCSLYVHFNKLPKDKEEIEEFVRILILYLGSHLENDKFNPKFKKYVELNSHPIIFKYLDEFQIFNENSEEFRLAVGNINWEYGGISPEELSDNFFQEVTEINKKYSSSSSDVILLLEIIPGYLPDYVIKYFKEKCDKICWNFKEIWSTSLANDGYCDRLYP